MLATLVDEAFDSPGWLFEIKWDGYRAIASVIDGKVELYSRNLHAFNEKYPPIVAALQDFDRNFVIDGEIVALDDKGVSRFQYLQNWQSDPQGELAYYAFDILWLDGRDLSHLPLIDRKKILQDLVPSSGAVRFSDQVEKNGKKFFEAAKRNDLEGIIAKKNGQYLRAKFPKPELVKDKDIGKAGSRYLWIYTTQGESPIFRSFDPGNL